VVHRKLKKVKQETKKLAPLVLSDRQRRLLQGFERSHKIASQLKKRVRFILHSASGYSLYRITQCESVRYETVKLWYSRWQNGYEALCEFEGGIDGEGVSDGVLLKRMKELLGDKSRPGPVPRISPSQKAQIVALACERPADHGLPVGRWTHELLAKAAIDKGIVDYVCPRHVGNILKKSGGSSA
jgi:transposase